MPRGEGEEQEGATWLATQENLITLTMMMMKKRLMIMMSLVVACLETTNTDSFQPVLRADRACFLLVEYLEAGSTPGSRE